MDGGLGAWEEKQPWIGSLLGLFTNRWLWLGIAGMTSLQLLFVYHPTMNRLFDSAPLDLRDWTAVGVASLAIYTAVAWEKRFHYRTIGSAAAPHRIIKCDSSVACVQRP